MVGRWPTRCLQARRLPRNDANQMLPQPDPRSGAEPCRRRGAGCQKKPSSKKDGKVFFLDIPFYRTPGPTDYRGFFEWDTADPNSTVMQARSYAVVAQVTKSQDNEPHGIEAEFGCVDLTGDGCSSTMGLASMSIA